MAEMAYAADKGIPARWFNPPPGKEQDPIAAKVCHMINYTQMVEMEIIEKRGLNAK